MKQINQYIQESILDDEEDIMKNDDWVIEQWLKDNYEIHGEYTIKNHIINVTGNIYVTNKKITQLLPKKYIFGTIYGDFYCAECKKLKSLKGCPEIVKQNFNCSECDELISLEGGPKQVGLGFFCSYCKKLKSLKGFPKIINGRFECMWCDNLTSLKGMSDDIAGSVDISHCKNLKTLSGISKSIGGTLFCYDCGAKFSQEYVNSLTYVYGTIIGGAG